MQCNTAQHNITHGVRARRPLFTDVKSPEARRWRDGVVPRACPAGAATITQTAAAAVAAAAGLRHLWWCSPRHAPHNVPVPSTHSSLPVLAASLTR